MKNLIVFAALFCTSLLFSQETGSVTGTVLDKEVFNEPLIFAEVQVKNTTKKVQTNFRGNFKITDIAPGDYTLEISYLGYEKVEIPVIVHPDAVTSIVHELAAKKLSVEDIATLDVTVESDKASSSKDFE